MNVGVTEESGHLQANWIDVNPFGGHADVLSASPSEVMVTLTNSNGAVKDGHATLLATSGMKDLGSGQLTTRFPTMSAGQHLYYVGGVIAETKGRPSEVKVTAFQVS